MRSRYYAGKSDSDNRRLALVDFGLVGCSHRGTTELAAMAIGEQPAGKLA
ncbi:hypothetical protein [[Phormidium] sp. ETS-05]|nr:hypothetical protein [[Phormidium] sp. ETS-05]